MRVRKKKNAPKRMAACADCLIQSIHELPPLAADRPLHLEIGCGKGTFIVTLAKQNPDVFYLAVERVFDVALLTAEKIAAQGIENVKLMVAGAEQLPELLPANSVSRIYLNFSDPWPKAKHAKRRLTHHRYLALYKQFMRPGAEIIFKTDNRPLFDFSLEEFAANGFTVQDVTYDLHRSEWEAGNIHTEYEETFSAKGFAINRAVAVLQS